MRVCGLTGGVGMGKTTAASFFSSGGTRVIDTDVIARQMVEPGLPALTEILDCFGRNLADHRGELRRDELARIVFADPVARVKLEAILHPRIREAWYRQIDDWRREGHPLALVIIPLLFETRAESHFDKVICVACTSLTQQARLRERGWSDPQIEQRVAAQMPVAQKIARADFVIWTEGLPVVHEQQVTQILARL
jgi:dephospho-CoA kinase